MVLTTLVKCYFCFRVFVIVCDAAAIRAETATAQGKFYFFRATKFLDACRGLSQFSAFKKPPIRIEVFIYLLVELLGD